MTAPDETSVEAAAAGDIEGREAEAAAEDLGAPTLAAAIEALLLVSVEPVPVLTLAQWVRRPVSQVEAEVQRLAAQYASAGRGFRLHFVAGGWRYSTSLACAPVVERSVLEGQHGRLSQAALETLAVVAYRQPVTRGRVSGVRAVNVDGVMRTLLARGLVTEVGHDPGSAAVLYGTTDLFCEKMGLASLAELPDLAELLPGLEHLDELLDGGA